MVPDTELAKAGYRVFKERITYRHGFYQFLSSDATTSSGHKTHWYVGDETHEHKSPYLVECMIGGMSARSNPLGWQITTAGVDKLHFCYTEYREDVVRILTRKADLDHTFGVIYAVDENDDWQDERVWRKANPNIDVSTDIERLRERCREAQSSSLRKQIFLNEHLNIWGSEETGHFKAADWDACYDPNLSEADLVGMRCAGIFDLSQTRDMSALVYLFHPEQPTNPDNPKAGGRWIAVARHFLPKERDRCNNATWQKWVRKGYIIECEGRTIRQQDVLAQILRDHQKFRILEWVFDPMFAGDLVPELDKRWGRRSVTAIQQHAKNEHPGILKMETHFDQRTFAHLGDPVLRYCVLNVRVRSNGKGHLYMYKESDDEKIDSAECLAMGFARTHTPFSEKKTQMERLLEEKRKTKAH